MASSDSFTTLPVVGRAHTRIDGPLKVCGVARYSSDFNFPELLHAVPVCATIANGRVASIDASQAARMPGVRKIYTHENIGTFYRASKASKAMIDEKRPPLDDDRVRYYGQYVALVVADSFEQATAAARAVNVDYADVQAPSVSTQLSPEKPPEKETERGDPDGAYARAAVKLDHTYSTPVETHNPIELHASLAIWDGTHFTLYETTQAIMNYRAVMAQMLGVPTDNVRVITEYLGSGFGGKLWPWTQALLAAAAARDLHRPVKLVVSRQMMFHNVGHRPHTQQRIRLAADKDGTLVSLRHDYLYHRALLADYKEDCGEATGFLYSTPNLRVTSGYAERNVGPATSMRGPGAVPGLFALESAMDELAIALHMDPIALRLKNEPSMDEMENIPFSSRHLKECLTRGADMFGWSRRQPTVGAMRDGDTIIGLGVAGCSWIAERFPAQATVILFADGGVQVRSGTQDIGTGTYTVIAQMAAGLAGVDVTAVKVVIGDTQLPPGPWSGGSMATASMVPAMVQAIEQAGEQLTKIAAEDEHFKGVDAGQLAFTEGKVHRKDQAPDTGRHFRELLSSARMAQVEGHGKAEGTFGQKKKAFSTHSYGAHFVEVAWQPKLARLRVRRTLTVIDAGRIVNPLTGRNQIEGAVVMGIGMAMLEQTHYDDRNGMAANSNLADYMMTTHADMPPHMDVLFLDYPDTKVNAMGVRGIGEIGLAGIAAAITNAVYHATGVRVRDIPIHVEDLLASKVA
ncbi:xanthine dehydrogenase family protein molybdopterin-binding subunit [Dyella jejuensis]|uniref:Xanthine dehydrogenase family protein molybdopterin-binding subunit n=1 Tax=Dyella jejuensis TaxID=1432009 RepID=A0ABW8JF69_9GAMM